MQIELKRIIESVEKEKNIDKQLLLGALKDAVLSAAKKYFGDCSFEVKFNEDTEEIELWRYRIVVQDAVLRNPLRELSLSEAQAMDPEARVEDELGEALPTEQLGRIAAQAAKQVIQQKMVDAEKDRVLREFKDRKHQLISGQVRRFDKQDIIVDLGSSDGVLPLREQIPGERFKLRDKVTCLLLDVKKSVRGPQIVLSRAHPEMLIRLFEQEVAELSEGIISIQSAARDPGSRSKIAVSSMEPSVDPVGACVGMKGARVQAVVQELRGEKIDIIPFDRDPARFACNALAPAEVSKVIVNERLKVMEVIVPDDQLSLAIGRRGQNVRLAAQLTGWKLDIRSESKMRELVEQHKKVLSQIPSLGEMRAEILVNEGYKDPHDIARMDPKGLIKLLRLSVEEADQVLKGAEELSASQQSNQESVPASDADYEASFDPLLDSGVDMEAENLKALAQEEAALESLVAKARNQVALMDPEKVDPRSVPRERLTYWMTLRGVGEQTAAVLYTAGFQDYASVVSSTAEEIAHRTGLPFKLSGKLLAESAKFVGQV